MGNISTIGTADPSQTQDASVCVEEELLQAGDGRVRHWHHPDHPLPGGGAGWRGLVRPLSHGGVRCHDETERIIFTQGNN